ncbi:DNA methyltransferase [Mageeibacillus indolicus]|uniref:DNA methyltransferase n=1 Tax=Mageeibacillus indolicus TaxID=884684 RepID=UPI0009DE054D
MKLDPPYNTGSVSEHYDDNLEHSTWLSLMKPRLELLRNLLSMMEAFGLVVMMTKGII